MTARMSRWCNATFALPLQSPEPSCRLIMWRHIVDTGGSSIRRAFEDLMLETGSWQSVSRPDRLHVLRTCIMYSVYQPEALSRYLTCARQGGRSASAFSASVEYHIPGDVVRFRDHVMQLPGSADTAIAHAVVVTVVREPFAQIVSEWANPRAVNGHPEISTPATFIRSFPRDGQCAQLVKFALPKATRRRFKGGVDDCGQLAARSGFWEQGKTGLEGLLSRFDVVGVTEQLSATLLVVCVRAGMPRCPVLSRVNHGAARDRFAWDGELRALAEPRVSTDARLHRLAKARLAADMRQLDPKLTEQYLALGPPLGHCQSRFVFSKYDPARERARRRHTPEFAPGIKVRPECCLTHYQQRTTSGTHGKGLEAPVAVGRVCNMHLRNSTTRRDIN